MDNELAVDMDAYVADGVDDVSTPHLLKWLNSKWA
jgi:hypothetical protein